MRLQDSFGRVVLDEVDASSRSAAISAAVAAPPVSGGGSYTAGDVVDQSVVLKVSGTDPQGNPIQAPSSLPLA